eukprot:jgi/Psemu1/50059/gm1.50059_g
MAPNTFLKYGENKMDVGTDSDIIASPCLSIPSPSPNPSLLATKDQQHHQQSSTPGDDSATTAADASAAAGTEEETALHHLNNAHACIKFVLHI